MLAFENELWTDIVRKWSFLGAALAACVVTAPTLGAASTAVSVTPSLERAVWVNPYGNVKVQTGDCAGKLCGWVIWATPEAAQEAREAGTQNLVGTQLLQGYRSVGPGRWEGHVFVPDMGHRFYSTISQLNAETLKISGCVLGGLICKSQIWHKG